MAFWKITQFFKTGIQGWSESWHVEANTEQLAEIKAQQLTANRNALLAKGVDGLTVRVSEVDKWGDSRMPLALNPKGNVKGNALDKDVAGVGARIRLEAGAQYRSSRTLRGLPDSWIYYEEQKEAMWFKDDALSVISSFGKFLRGDDFRMLVKLKPPESPIVKVKEVGTDAQFDYVITTSVPHQLVTGDKVHMRGPRVKDYVGLRGEHDVFLIEDTSFEIRIAGDPTPVKYLGGVEYYKVRVGYKEYDNLTVMGAATRDTGRPFGQRRGRQRKKA